MAFIPGQGTLLKVGGTPTAIAQVKEIKGPGMERDAIETTHLTSTAKEFIAGLLDAGSLSFTVQYDPKLATAATLWSLTQTGEIEDWDLVFADTSEFDFEAFVVKFEPSGMETDEGVVAELEIKLTGLPTLTPDAP